MSERMTMSKIADFIADFVFPNRCPFCDGFIQWDMLCCDKCTVELEHADFCPKCGQNICECGEHDFAYDGCVTVIPYVDIGRKGILELKYRNGFNTAKLLVPEIIKRLNCLDSADIITAVPMTRKRRRETGYNQAEYIAKLLSKSTGIKCDFSLIGKRRSAPLQHELTREEREREAQLTYFPKKQHCDITGKTVILCDDIITTGSTLSACAAVLKKMGAKAVYCAALAGSYTKKTDDKKE